MSILDKEYNEMKKLLEDDEIGKIAEPILAYLKATMLIRDKNITQGESEQGTRYVYPWGFSQILLNCPEIELLDLTQFIAIFSPYFQEEVGYVDNSHRYVAGTRSPNVASEEWIIASKNSSFVGLLQHWDSKTPRQLKFPESVTILESLRWYLCLSLLEQSKEHSPAVEIEKVISKVTEKNQIPREFMDFEKMFFLGNNIYSIIDQIQPVLDTKKPEGLQFVLTARDRFRIVNQLQPVEGERIIYMLGKCAIPWRSSLGSYIFFDGPHSILLDPSVTTQLKKNITVSAEDIMSSIMQDYIQYAEEDPSNPLLRKKALTSLHKKFEDGTFTIMSSDLDEQEKDLLESDGWIRILPNDRIVLARGRTPVEIDHMISGLERESERELGLYLNRVITIKAKKEPSKDEKLHIENKRVTTTISHPVDETVVEKQGQIIRLDEEKKQEGHLAVFLGNSPENQKVRWQPGKSNNGHLIIIGGSGAGKTELIRCIAIELVTHRFPVLMIDFHGDMSPSGSDVHTYNISEGSPYYFNPLELDPKFPEITPLGATSDFVDAISINFPGIGIQQRDRLTEIISRGYRHYGITENPQTWSSELPFAFVQTEIINSDDREIQSLRAYLRRIFDYELFCGDQKFSTSEVINSQTITHINLKPLPEGLRSLYADLFLRRLYYALQTIGEIPRENISDSEKFRLFVIVDEAKLLVSEKQGIKAVLNKYATEMRKFGVGLILASQLISHFNDEILTNVAAKICMNAETQKQAKANSRVFGITENIVRNLKQGQGFLLRDDGQTELQVVPSWER